MYPRTPYTDSQELSFWSWSQKRKGFKRENNCFNLLFQSSQFLFLVKRERKSSIGRFNIKKSLYYFTVEWFYVKYDDKSARICKHNSEDICISWIYWYYCNAMFLNYSTQETNPEYWVERYIKPNNSWLKHVKNSKVYACYLSSKSFLEQIHLLGSEISAALLL